MARLNTRRSARQSEAQDPYDIPQSSPVTRQGVSTRATRRAQLSSPQAVPTRRSRRNGRAVDDLTLAEGPPRKKRHTRQQEHKAKDENVNEGHAESDGGRIEEDKDQDSRPSDAFLRNINEGIFANVLPENRQRQRPSQHPLAEEEARPQPSRGLKPQERGLEGEDQQPENPSSRKVRPARRKQKPQRTLSTEPATREDVLSSHTADTAIPTGNENPARPGYARSASSDLFVPSEPDEDESEAESQVDDLRYELDADETDDLHEKNGVSDYDNEPRPEAAAALTEAYENIATSLDFHGRSDPHKKVATIRIRADKLAYMEKTISTQNWSGLYKECRPTLLRKANESDKEWLKRLGLQQATWGRQVRDVIGGLQVILHSAPKIPKLDEQCRFFARRLNRVKDVMTEVQSLSDDILELLEMREEEHGQTAEAVHITKDFFVPMLVLMLGDTFRLGGSCGDDGEIDTVFAGTFTHVTLGILGHLTEVVLKLIEGLGNARSKAGEELRPLSRLHDQVLSFQQSVVDGLRVMEDRDPKRLRRARRRDDKAGRRHDQKRERGKMEERDNPFAAFIASTQQVRQSLSSVSGTQQTRAATRQPRPGRQVGPSGHDDNAEEAEPNHIEDNYEDNEDRQAREQLQRDEEQRQQQEVRLRRIALLKEQDKRAQEKREAEARARKEAMQKRFQVFIASTQKMHV